MRQFAYVAFVLAATIVVATTALGQSSRARPESRPFSGAERARLERGDLVVRQSASVVRGHKLVGGSAWIRVHRSPDAVYRAATDYSRWTRFIPRATETRRVRRGRASNVFVRQRYGPVDASYELRIDAQTGSHDVRFTLDPARPHTISEAWGYMSVTPYQGGSLLSFGVMVDVGDGLVRTLFEREVQRWALRVPQELRRWVESREAARHYGR